MLYASGGYVAKQRTLPFFVKKIFLHLNYSGYIEIPITPQP
jgi:hypothetical protein